MGKVIAAMLAPKDIQTAKAAVILAVLAAKICLIKGAGYPNQWFPAF
jgi:hypothetical protein